MLEVDEVTKTFRRRGGQPVRANDAVSLAVAAGEVVGLLGHNGAGKTTLVRQVAGLAVPDSGRIRLAGVDPVTQADRARRLCSLQPQGRVPLAGMSPREAVEAVGRIRGGRSGDVRRRRAELFAALDLERWADTPGQRLSGGVLRLTGFCLAAVRPGHLVVLDEPTNDVDPSRRRLLWAQVRALADAGRGVLVVTHNLGEAERVVDRAVVLDRGRVVADGTPARLRTTVGGDLRLSVVLRTGEAPPSSAPWPAVASSAERGRLALAVPASSAGEAVAWARELVAAGAAEEFSLAPSGLEDVYVALTGREEVRGDRVA